MVDVTKSRVELVDRHGREWRAWIPPRGPQDFEGGDVVEGAHLGPYGDSFWPTKAEARAFVERVTGAPPQLETSDGRIEVTVTGETFHDALDALEEALRRIKSGQRSSRDRTVHGELTFTVDGAP